MPLDDELKKEFQQTAGNAAISAGFSLLQMFFEGSIKRGERNKAIREMEEQIAEKTQTACLLYDNKQYMEAILACEYILALDKNNTFAYYLIGRSYYDLKLYEEALPAFSKALSYNPQFPDAYLFKGFVCECLEKWQDAVDAFDNAIKYSTEEISVTTGEGYTCSIHYHKANILAEELERYEEALQATMQALIIVPHDEYAHFLMAGCLYELGRYQEAITALEKASRINPTDKNYPKFIKECRQALRVINSPSNQRY